MGGGGLSRTRNTPLVIVTSTYATRPATAVIVAEESPASRGSKKGSRDKENMRQKVPIGVSLEIVCLSRGCGACFSFADPRRKKKIRSSRALSKNDPPNIKVQVANENHGG